MPEMTMQETIKYYFDILAKFDANFLSHFISRGTPERIALEQMAENHEEIARQYRGEATRRANA